MTSPIDTPFTDPQERLLNRLRRLEEERRQTGLRVSRGAGAVGAPGADGDDGRAAGYAYSFDTSTTMADPGAGDIRFNNATVASVTELAVSDTDDEANNLDAVLDQWDDSTSAVRGQIILSSADLQITVFNVTATITDEGTWHRVPVAHVSGALFSSGEDIKAVFIRTGDEGDVGPEGPEGPEGPAGEDGADGGAGTIAHDASSNVAAGTGALSWTHTPTGTPRGAIVLIAQNAGATDEVTGVTYGGVAMSEVPLSPMLHPTGSEDGVLYGYFLGAGLPTGAQTVAVSVNGTASSKRPVCHTVTASDDVRLAATKSLDSSGVANPSVSLSTPSGLETAVYAVLHSGQDAVSSITEGTGYTETLDHDFGSQTASWTRRTANPTGDSVTVDWTVASEEAAILAVALQVEQPNDFGYVTALPAAASCAIGDRCSYVADSANGIVWDLVYDGVGTYPWKFAGGSAMQAEVDAFESTTSTSFANLGTAGPAVTTPLAMECFVRHGAMLYNSGTSDWVYASFANGATSAIDADEIYSFTVNALASGSTIRRKTVAAGASIAAKYRRSATGSCTAATRFIEVIPIRVGY